MLTLLSIVLAACALLLLVPTVVFVAEVWAGCLLPEQESKRTDFPSDKRVAVLIPAHNESTGITSTIQDIKLQLRPGDRLVVVADNCSDDTGAIAVCLGAEVTARNDLTRIGKGYALDWGIKYLAAAPPDIVIAIDADCRVSDKALENLSGECSASGRPVQALYLMHAVPGSPINQQVSQFAWLVKNLVRPLGLHKLKLPCPLMGTGMAFPWEIIESANLSSDFIVEDMKLGLELAAQGHASLFCPSAIFTSTFPTSDSGTRAQRQRWEQGHISLILSDTPKLLLRAIKQRDLRLWAAALDLAVPPLSLLVSILAAAAMGAALVSIVGVSEKPFFLMVACLFLVAAAILLAWIKHGRAVLPLDAVVLIFPYLAKKVSLYAALAAGRKISGWIRADRSH
jgi:cellulose synthase/poly-beta-1,6-N-acetylglucosamine synthase-like glycosyltransferase